VQADERALPDAGGVGSRVDDGALVAAIEARDPDALARGYREHAHAVFDFSRCIVRNPSLAEDVVQDVFLRLWNSPRSYDPDRGSLRSFLLTMAHGRSIDLVRSETSRQRREERETRLAAVDAIRAEDDDIVTHDVVHTALGALAPSEREAIALAYFAGYSYRQVAAVLDVPEGTIKNRIRTGLAHLRRELNEDEDAPEGSAPPKSTLVPTGEVTP
jgi:RNA polymerase sigma-70 factor (ECF subfamily)